MRHVKFVLSALAILLAGAMAAGIAARSVAAPRAGEVVSAGVVSVPSVLGQTAEEALFYPWSMYDLQTLTPLSDEAQTSIFYGGGDTLTCILAMEALGTEFDWPKLVDAQRWNQSDTKTADMVFLKDYPARLPEDNTPVTLSYALNLGGSPLSVSWLMRPAQEAELTEAQRQAALEKVKGDLAELLWYLRVQDSGRSNGLMELLENFGTYFSQLELRYHLSCMESLIQLLQNQFQSDGEYGASFEFYDEEQKLTSAQPEPQIPTLEELIEQGQPGPAEFQFISTPRQIVLLFDIGWITFGVYYDIQLERYSGFGMSNN